MNVKKTCTEIEKPILSAVLMMLHSRRVQLQHQVLLSLSVHALDARVFESLGHPKYKIVTTLHFSRLLLQF